MISKMTSLKISLYTWMFRIICLLLLLLLSVQLYTTTETINTVILFLLTNKIGSKVASQDISPLIHKVSGQDILHNKRSSADIIKNFEMISS